MAPVQVNGQVYVPLTLAAAGLGWPARTLRTWAGRGVIPSAVVRDELHVDLKAAARFAQTAPCLDGWTSPETAALVLDVSANTVRSWMRRGDVETSCSVARRRIEVWFPGVEERATRRAA